MKTSFFKPFLFFFLFSQLLTAQTLDWGWAKGSGDEHSEFVRSMVADSENNVYMCGSFGIGQGIRFDTIVLKNATDFYVTSDLFIVKYDDKGKVQWAKSAGGEQNEEAVSIVKDADDNIYVAGSFVSKSIRLDTVELTNADTDADGFIVKYDKNGKLLKLIHLQNVTPRGICLDKSDNIVLTGIYWKGITLGSFNLYSRGTFDIVTLKLDSSGNVLWARSDGGSIGDLVNSIAIDNEGNIFICGYFASDVIYLGNGKFRNIDNGGYDTFIVKFNSSGLALWEKTAGGDRHTTANSVATDASGNAYITGYFDSNTISFDSTTFKNMDWDHECFIVKYDRDGKVLWAKNPTGPVAHRGDQASPKAIITDATGNIYVSGSFNKDTIYFDNKLVTNSGRANLFVTKLDSDGKVQWLKGCSDSATEVSADCIALSKSGDIYISGTSNVKTLTFGSTVLSYPHANSGINSTDIFTTVLTSAMQVNQFTDATEIILYPNPTNGKFRIKTELQTKQITVYTMLGTVVYQSEKVESEIDLSAQPAGIYFVKVVSKDNFVSTQKLILN
jgi:hypothetical protein